MEFHQRTAPACATGLLRYRAGHRATQRLRREGLTAGDLRVVVGAATGPRWLALAGLDRAIIEEFFQYRRPLESGRLLVGASAGAWRMLALASDRPAEAHQRLVNGYVEQVFPRGVRPSRVSSAYRRMLGELFPAGGDRANRGDAVHDVALLTTRLRHGWLWRRRSVQLAGLATAAALHRLHPRAASAIYERVMFHTRPSRFGPPFDGRIVELGPENLQDAALASGTVPFYMQPVESIAGAAPGAYVDGGLGDYHLRQRFVEHDGEGAGLVLFPHHQRSIVPTWFDRKRDGTIPTEEVLDDLLQIYPSDEFVATLPDGRIPDRDDFLRFADAPQERIRRWKQTVDRSRYLGDALLDDLRSGRFVDRIESIGAEPGRR